MKANNQPVVVKKGPSTLARAKFGPGMLLQHDDLEQLNVYTRELNRLMFRSLFGCGVACGLVVSTDVKCGKVNVTVGSGLALDCQGDPIYVPQPQSICVDEECDPNIPSPLWVVLCGTEKCCAPRTSMCSSDDDETASVCTRERDGFEIRIMRSRPQCTCSCPDADSYVGAYEARRREHHSECWCANPNDPCYRDHYAGKCGCDCEDCEACDCNCVLLARLERDDRLDDKYEYPVWKADHRVRRFIRPVLMRDPQVQIEEKKRKRPNEQGAYEQEQEERGQYEQGQEDQGQDEPAQAAQAAAGVEQAAAQEPQAEPPTAEGGGRYPSGTKPSRKSSSRRS